jgi:hypothetical protein
MPVSPAARHAVSFNLYWNMLMKTNTRQHTTPNRTQAVIAALCLVMLQAIPSLAAQQFDHKHKAYEQILKAHVVDGRVDYRTLKADPQPLNRYLNNLAAVPKQQFQSSSKEQQLAFLVNLYNAATLKLIVDHYPVKSIKDIGSWFKGPWDQQIVRLFGTTITLNTLEHDILRKNYNEPRLHLALVCAAKSCPPLRSEAYTAEKLDGQLNDQARTYLASPQGLRIDRKAREVRVSSIFKWYGKDFVNKYTPGPGFAELNKTESAVISFCSSYVSDQNRAYLMTGDYTVKYIDYDWSLNEGGSKNDTR